MSETERDMSNVEAWASVIEDMLHLVPTRCRLPVLQLALEQEDAAIKEREKHPNGLVFVQFDGESLAHDLRHWHTEMRLISLLVQVFVRRITNNHSKNDAGKILFAHHPYGHGS